MTVQYAKGKSDVVAKLDGTYRMPAPGGQGSGAMGSELQQQIFGGIPGVAPAKVAEASVEVGGTASKAVKRGREDDEDSDEGAPMEEDSDAPMEEGSDDED